MCGIVGGYNACIPNMKDLVLRLTHRGPDAAGVWESGKVQLGHTRLSIIDPGPRSDQPMVGRRGVIAYNGEMWNYQERSRGMKNLKTKSDTEVLLRLCEKDSDLSIIEGMFAFAYAETRGLLLCRDRFGKVPLFWRTWGDAFAFASERKALIGVGKGTVMEFPAGCYMHSWAKQPTRYYTLPTKMQEGELLPLLRSAVRKRLMADVPLCCLISGGIDSSVILALAHELQPGIEAYTAVLNSDSADLQAARRLCDELGVKLNEVIVDPPTIDAIDKTIWSIESPLKTQVEIGILSHPLAARIRADGFRVCLSGEGSDEIFGGYGSTCRKGSKSDEAWREAREYELKKMSRANFQRCNMIFMAHGVECRLPFLDQAVVEWALTRGRKECPAGKRALKKAVDGLVPEWIIKRPKVTFQGEAGMSAAVRKLLGGNPVSFYSARYKKLFGEVA